jgi:ABC-type antimicrobial peptide transport system permease subunit
VSRSKEVGIRKVVGAARQSLIRQFIGESILISFISLFFAVLMVHLLHPYFNDLTGRKINLDYTNPLISGSLVAIALVTGVLAGSYPAFFLSSLQTIHVLKGKFSGLTGAGVRKVLVVFQFSLSIILILCAWVVYQQLDYMRNKNLGFDRNNIFYIMSTEGIRKTVDAFRNEALKNPMIQSVAQADDNPMEIFDGMVLADNAWPGKTKADNILFRRIQCDPDFLPALGFTIVEGRNFSSKLSSDSTSYIINQEAAKKMRLSDPVGQQLIAPYKGQIVGVVKDFHSTGLRAPIEPVIIAMRPENARRVFFRYQQGHAVEALQYIESVYKKFEPAFPIEYKFLDETFGSQYQDEIMTGKLSICFTAMAIFISCLGLFGLASFTAERRAKEISLRKVLGATVSQMIGLLCRDFVLLVGISLLIGLPVAWWGAQKYLEGYRFHTTLNAYVFGAAALSMLLVALLAVSYQSAKAAMANPAERLTYE